MKSAFAVAMDPRIVKLAQRGDREALYEIYKQFERPCYNLAFRLCQCPVQAQDVLQDGMLQVIQGIGQYRFEAPFWAWIRRVFINAALMHMRNRKKGENLEILVDAVGEETVDRMALQRDIAAVFARLAPERRAVLWLYVVEGYSHQEIAAMMGYSTSYSKTQLMRARRQIRQWWQPGNAEGEAKGERYDDRH